MDEERRLRKSLERYAEIDPLLRAELPPGEEGALLRRLAAEFGHSPQTLRRWRKAFREGGLTALMPPEHRRDWGKLVAFPPEVLEEAVRLREEEPRRSTSTIILLIERLHPDWTVRIARSTLDRHLRRLGKTRKQLAHPVRPRRHFAKAARNDLWIADFCFPELVWRDGDVIRPAILLAILDHKTRFVVGGGFVPNRQAVHVEEALKRAIGSYGLPKAFYVDNGQELVGSLITEGCKHLGIVHIRASVGEPEGRGALERFFRSFQESFVPEMAAKAMVPTLAELNRFWMVWLEQLYHVRPHSALEGRSPRQAWEEDKTPLRFVDPVTVDGAFLLRQTRRVSKTALVQWEGRTYLCDDALVGQQVEIRFHPTRQESLQIWKGGHFLQVAFRYIPPENVPHVPKTPPRPTPRESLLDELDRQHQAALEQQRSLLPPVALPSPALPFTEAAAAALLAYTLGRDLEGRELAWLAESWRRSGGWDRDLTERAVAAYAARYGTGRHLAYYLEFIEAAHLRARQKEEHRHG